MKNLLTLALVFLTLYSAGQDYKLFHAGSNKLYTTYPIAGLTSGIAFDSVKMMGTDSVYFNYTAITSEFEIESDTCEFWGGPYCFQQDKPLWFGAGIIRDNNSIYSFMTGQDDTLSFNFDLLPGDSSLFYEDSSQYFYIVYEGADTFTILNILDSARFYRISNYDISGNVINSPLNNEKIIIGKEMGLAGFFRIDSFPQVQQPVSLVGNRSPAAGVISLTNEMVYDHQVGDEIQYLDKYVYLDGPPWFNYTNYIKHTFLDRIDTQDSIIYTVERSTYKTDSNLLIQDTIVLRYKRNTIIAESPFDKLDQNHSLLFTSFYAADYCDLNAWTYKLDAQYKIYCPADNCWGYYDIPGPPPEDVIIYVCGLGRYLEKFAIIAPPPEGYYHMLKIIYFKKDGIECGEEVVVNVKDPAIPASGFSVYPNPAKDRLFVRTNGNLTGTIILYDLNGRQIEKVSIQDQLTSIDTGGMKSGMYFLKFVSDYFVEVQKIIIKK
jgi:hypothetical protein